MPEVRAIGEMDPKDALVIVAFPSAGAASPIAGQYLINHLEMPLVGDLEHPAFQGIVHVHEGRPTSPVRIHGGEVACDLDGPCQRTYVISTEVPIMDQLQFELTELILAWAKEARLVLLLDSIQRDEDDSQPDVFHVANTDLAFKRLGKAKSEALPNALMTGMNAMFLGQSETPVAALVVEARGDHPDGRAAAALVTALDPMIPQIEIDPAPLLKDARALEAQIQAAIMEAERAQAKRSPTTFI